MNQLHDIRENYFIRWTLLNALICYSNALKMHSACRYVSGVAQGKALPLVQLLAYYKQTNFVPLCRINYRTALNYFVIYDHHSKSSITFQKIKFLCISSCCTLKFCQTVLIIAYHFTLWYFSSAANKSLTPASRTLILLSYFALFIMGSFTLYDRMLISWCRDGLWQNIHNDQSVGWTLLLDTRWDVDGCSEPTVSDGDDVLLWTVWGSLANNLSIFVTLGKNCE